MQQVDRELDAREVQIDRPGEGRNQKGLGEARYALEKQVAAGEQGNQHPLNDEILADNRFGNLLTDFLHKLRQFGDGRPFMLQTQHQFFHPEECSSPTYIHAINKWPSHVKL